MGTSCVHIKQKLLRLKEFVQIVFSRVVGNRVSEQSVELGVDLVCDVCEIFWTVFIVQVIGLDHQNFSLIISNPLLVSVIQVAEILDTDALLVVSASLLNLRNQGRDRAAEINK